MLRLSLELPSIPASTLPDVQVAVTQPPLRLAPALSLSLAPVMEEISAERQSRYALSTLNLRWTASMGVTEDDDDEPLPQSPGSPSAPPASRREESLVNRPAMESSAADNLPDLSGSELGLAPIRYGGRIASNFTRIKDATGGKSINTGTTYDLNGSSYVYQPWIAQVSGQGNFASSRSRSYAGNASDDTNNKSQSAGWGGNLNLLPMSNYPFQASLNRSRASTWINDGGSKRSTSTAFTATQSYRPEQGNESYVLNFANMIARSEENQKGQATNLNGSYSNPIDEFQSINANASLTRTATRPGHEKAKSFTVSGNHNWNYSDEMQMYSSAFFSHNKAYLTGGDTDDSVFQTGSNFNFQFYDDEDELLPLTASAGTNLMHMVADNDGVFRRTTYLSSNGNLSYRFTPQLVGSMSANIGRIMPSGQGKYLTNQGSTGNLSYFGLPTSFGEYQYNWSTNGGVGMFKVTNVDVIKNYYASAMHNVSRAIPLSQDSVISLSFGQGLGAAYSNTSSASSSLSNNVSASWSNKYGETLNTSLLANFTDSRTFGLDNTHMQNFTLTGMGQAILSGQSSLSVVANVVRSWSDQIAESVKLGNLTLSTNASPWVGSMGVSYSNSSLFRIPRLVYSATINFTVTQNAQDRSPGSLTDYKPWQRNKVFSQNLSYALGRLQLQAMNVIAQNVDGSKSVIIYGQIVRNLSGFF